MSSSPTIVKGSIVRLADESRDRRKTQVQFVYKGGRTVHLKDPRDGYRIWNTCDVELVPDSVPDPDPIPVAGENLGLEEAVAIVKGCRSALGCGGTGDVLPSVIRLKDRYDSAVARIATLEARLRGANLPV